MSSFEPTIRKYIFPKDWCQLGDDFKRMFHFSIIGIYDPFMSAISGEFKIDVHSMDDVLHRKFGDYEECGMSMADIIERNYSHDAVVFLDQLL